MPRLNRPSTAPEQATERLQPILATMSATADSQAMYGSGRGAAFESVLKRSSKVRAWGALALGLVLLAGGLYINWNVTVGRGEDFGHLYVMGKSLVRGFDVYLAPDLHPVYLDMTGSDDWVPWGAFYTPSAGAATLPLSFLPYGPARAAFFLISCLVLLAGANQLIQLLKPRWHMGYRVLLLGGLMCASANRWAFLYLQAAPLIFGLLCMFVVALHQRRISFALVTATLGLCVKFSLGLPFLGLALVQRRYALAVAIAAAWLVVNGVGFIRLGGVDAVRGYQQTMSTLERADEVNYPDFRSLRSMTRTDWPYLLNAISPDLQRSALLGMLLSAASCGLVGWQAWRSRKFADELGTTAAFMGPLVCLSLLSVYHHHYDAISLLAPALFYLSWPGTYDRRLIALFVVPALAYAGLHQVGNVELFFDHMFGGNAAILVKLYGVVTMIVTLVASLLLLESYIRGRAGQGRGVLVAQQLAQAA